MTPESHGYLPLTALEKTVDRSCNGWRALGPVSRSDSSHLGDCAVRSGSRDHVHLSLEAALRRGSGQCPSPRPGLGYVIVTHDCVAGSPLVAFRSGVFDHRRERDA